MLTDFHCNEAKKKIFLWKKKFKMATQKKPHFPAPPIFNICSWKFHALVLWLVGLIDAKGIDMAQCVWPWGCRTWALKQAKNGFFVFFGCFRAYVGQPHGHTRWAIPIPFTSINPTNPRTNPWNFYEQILKIGGAGKWGFFVSAILNFFFQKKKFFFASLQWKSVNIYGTIRVFWNFDDYPDSSKKLGVCNNMEYTVFVDIF